MDQLQSGGTPSIVLKGGGDPTVHPRICDMLYLGRDAGLKIGLITNGSLSFAGTHQAIIDCTQWVRFSVDAATADTHHHIHGYNEFTKVIDHIAYLAGHVKNTLIGMDFVTEQRNYDQIIAFAELVKILGAAYVTIRCVFDPANPLSQDVCRTMRKQAVEAKRLSDDAFSVFLGHFSDGYLDQDPNRPFAYEKCLGPNLVGGVGADGEVYACCFLRGNKQFSFGNIQEERFDTIWYSQRRAQVMQAIYRGACGYICQGGMTDNRDHVYN